MFKILLITERQNSGLPLQAFPKEQFGRITVTSFKVFINIFYEIIINGHDEK